MDVHEFKITTNWAKRMEKETTDLDAKLRSQVDDLKKSTKTIECIQLNVQKLSYHAPIIQEQLEDLQTQIQFLN
jgi:septal ring factor EnvC (AmiA/AmiB activator)